MVISSVERALDTLVYLARVREARVVDVAAHLQVDKSNASRLLNTLAKKGFVERSSETGKFRLGMVAGEIGLAVLHQFELRERTRPYLGQLFELTQETVLLMIPTVTGEAMCIDKLEPTHSLRTHAQIGERVPLHSGSAAKVLLAFGDERQREAVLSKPLRRFTPNTIVDPDELRKELEKIRNQGFAVSRGETSIGAVGVAAPLFDYSGRVVAAFSVGGPEGRITPERIPVFARYVKEVAAQASRALGYQGAAGSQEAAP